MTWMLIFAVMVGAAAVVYFRSRPGEFPKLAAQVIAAGTGAAVRPLDLKRLGGEIHREVIGGAIALPHGKYAHTTVWVYLSTSAYQRFGGGLLTRIGDQVREMVDKDLVQRNWEASGPTSVTWHVDPDLQGDDYVIVVLGGEHTIVDPDRVRATPIPDETQVVAPRASVTVDGRERDLPSRGTWVVGRSEGCDVMVASTDSKVSRRHFKLEISGSRVTLTDSSTNGTRVNGTKVPKSKAVVLSDGDTIELPDGTTMVLHVPDAVTAKG